MKTCMNCQNAETNRGYDCPRCDTLLTLACMVNSKWTPDELSDLSKTLRSASIWELRKERSGAILLQNLLGVCQRLCMVRKLDPDAMRLSLASRIDKQLVHLQKVAEYDAQNGAGAYAADLNRAIAEAGADLVAKLGAKIKRQPIAA
jgi:hypothetical protein